ncbi:DNA repair protein [Aspergillus avenaceus]|uniref:DNA repair protein n=1 Tax=Aspergillus avenaceus TaxID=36643 RepID=A0A5N6TES8_ASPAV|nr:DNA repair protein [Aspergillus avenaceus]
MADSSSNNTSNEKQMRLVALRISIENLNSEIARVEAQRAETRASLNNDPSATLQRHIQLLHDYNEIKDTGQGLMSLIADARGMRQADVEKEYGINVRD